MITTRQIQILLTNLGYDVGPVDGLWGNKSKAATRQFQQDAGLTVDGIPGPKTQAALEKYTGEVRVPFYQGNPGEITNAQFNALAEEFDLEPALIRTVKEVEAPRGGFTGNFVTALYEPHIAYRYSEGAVRHRLMGAGLAYREWIRGSYPKTSYGRIDEATAIAGEEIAALATSWGSGQVMGFNHKYAGFDSAVEMVKDFAKGEDRQLAGMLKFINSSPTMMRALRSKNWAKFAELYNGEEYQKNQYDKKLAAAYKRNST